MTQVRQIPHPHTVSPMTHAKMLPIIQIMAYIVEVLFSLPKIKSISKIQV